MEDKALYVMAGFDEATAEHLDSMQNSLYENGFEGRQTRGLFPHITLGKFPTDMEEELKTTLRQAAAQHGPFDITFNHVGIFGGGEVLFVAPDTNKELLALKERFGDSWNWTAHSTMFMDEPSVVHRAVPILLEQFAAFSGNVTSISLYEFQPSRHILTLELGK